MKHPILVMSLIFSGTLFSLWYESPAPVATRYISSVEVLEDGTCIENDSKWGEGPREITKEGICRCHPEMCEEKEVEKSYEIESN